jgi:uncharacterized membrane protein YjfL (UPF0719 family)
MAYQVQMKMSLATVSGHFARLNLLGSILPVMIFVFMCSASFTNSLPSLMIWSLVTSASLLSVFGALRG